MNTMHRDSSGFEYLEDRLYFTSNLDVFVSNKHNRDIHNNTRLEESIKKRGFLPDFPIIVEQPFDGKVEIVSGHHRVFYARKHNKVPVYFRFVRTHDLELYDYEATSLQWYSTDFIRNGATRLKPDYIALEQFTQESGLKPITAANLLRGSSGSGAAEAIKRGTFTISNMELANQVVTVAKALQEEGLEYGTHSACTRAIIMCIKNVRGFSIDRLIDKIHTHPYMFKKGGTVKEYIRSIHDCYNRSSHNRLDIVKATGNR